MAKRDMGQNRKTIYIYTSNFPYGMDAETFLGEELNVASEKGLRVVVIPTRKAEGERPLPQGVEVDRSIAEASIAEKLFAAIRTFCSFGMMSIWACIFCDRLFRFRYITDAIKYIYAANLVYQNVVKKASSNSPCIFYGYWLTYYPIAFACYKRKHPDSVHRFVCRGHGSDIYSVDVGVYYPLRQVVLDRMDAVFTVSEYGRRYLMDKYPKHQTPISIARLGVRSPSNLPAREEAGVIRIVSCSAVIELKRVEKLFSALKAYVETNGCEMEWHHFGDGDCYDRLSNRVAQEGNGHLHCVLHGFVPNAVLMDYYTNNAVDAFVSVSESEGVPVSMMEALSYNIPILSTEVGGCGELVTKETGCLINKNFTQEEFNNGLSFILSNRESYPRRVHDFYMSNYNAIQNYNKFYSEILSL